MSEETLITDYRVFPRSEYYTRFIGTTAFAMNEPAYWGTYHRSESTRFFHEAGGRKEIQFSSPCAKKPVKTNSFAAHTGGVLPPFSHENYSEVISLEQHVSRNDINVRDELLHYKRQMSKIVVGSFKDIAKKNTQKIKKKGSQKIYFIRPIVYYENNYPCILVKLPVLNPAEAQSEAAKYWSEHPKPFQRLLLASFIAFLNVEALKTGVPIEMVIRSSFGHDLPSICETDNTFRINVGVIPKAYAQLIGKAIYKLNQSINQITDEDSPEVPFNTKFLANVRQYNAKKLKKAIDEKDRYKSLRNSRDYKKATESDEAFNRLYQSFLELNKGKERKGGANFVPVCLDEKATLWQAIRQAGDTMGRPLLAECFRENKTVDWFANAVMKAMLTAEQEDNPIEFALSELLKLLKYEDTVTMNYTKIDRDLLKKPKREFKNLSFKPFYAKDPAFCRITHMLFKAFCADRPSEAMYAELERAGVNFFSTYKGSQIVQEEPDYGSESEFSEDFSVKIESKKASKNILVAKEFHASHSKLRVCSGMKAILLAQYGAFFYLKENGAKTFRQDIIQMYYEVEDALKMVRESTLKIKSNSDASILHYDLNHCNAANAGDNVTLSEKLHTFEPSVVILDYTSSTYDEIEDAFKKCFIRDKVQVVIMVDSGLKNNQGGLDFNPYGEVRIWARDAETRENIIEKMKKGLSEKDKLPPETHEMVRACKRRGLAVSLYGFFKTDQDRFQAVNLPTPVSVRRLSP